MLRELSFFFWRRAEWIYHPLHCAIMLDHDEREAEHLLGGSAPAHSQVLSTVSKRLRRTQALVCALVIALVVTNVPHFDSRAYRHLSSLGSQTTSQRPPRSKLDVLQSETAQPTLRGSLRPDVNYIVTLKNGAWSGRSRPS